MIIVIQVCRYTEVVVVSMLSTSLLSWERSNDGRSSL